MNLEEAIKTAIEFENKVYSTYKEAEEKASDPVGKRIFSVLAKEEQGHIAYLEHCLKDWQATGELKVADLDTAIPTKEKIEAGLEQVKSRLESGEKASATEIELLQRALEVERETAGFYRRVVSELKDDAQRLFARFLEIEDGHLAIVQAEMDSVTGLGFWFDMQEFDLEAGG